MLEETQHSADFDSDGDGIPDEWERAYGLNPNNAYDGKYYTLDSEKKWYTNVEIYLNSLVEDIMNSENADAITAVEEYYPNVTPTGILLTHDAQHVATDYYDLRGVRITNPTAGIYLRVDRLADGRSTTRKVCIR